MLYFYLYLYFVAAFIKNSDLSMKNSVKEEKEIRKSFVRDLHLFTTIIIINY